MFFLTRYYIRFEKETGNCSGTDYLTSTPTVGWALLSFLAD